ncbi:MAG: BtpA/SgcQ family protein [Desulfurococcales archaeon]|nr:BtpA/SgcQ family protein [Desulfurococcales archaeon]
MVEDIFGKCKPVIGVVHLPPLPGSYGYRRRPYPYPHGKKMGIESIIEYAVNEALKYEKAGFDAIIVENYGDKPYKMRVGAGETAAMARIVSEVRKALSIPVGVNILRNSPYEALYVAHISGASFIRVNSLCETRASVEGLIEPSVKQLAQAITELDIYDDIMEGKISVLADINVKHSYPIYETYNIKLTVRDCIDRAGFPIKSMIITGPSTGYAPEVEYVEEIAGIIREHGARAIVGSGIRPENIARFWRLADGFIVGTSVKLGEETENVVSIEKAEDLVSIIERYRQTWPC